LPILGNLVGYVINVGPEKQMARVAAEPVVASMQHMEAVRYFTAKQFPRETMRTNESPTNTWTDSKVTVTVTCYRGGPQPALFWRSLLNLR